MVRFQGKIKKWGNSYGILLSKQELEKNKFQENQEVTIDLHANNNLDDLFGKFPFKKKVEDVMREVDEGYPDDF